MRKPTGLQCLHYLVAVTLHGGVCCFVPQHVSSSRPLAFMCSSRSRSSSRSSSQVSMVFDFFKERASEGVEQLSKLTKSASEGRLGEGLSEAAAYTRETNEKFALGLAKSRNKLRYDLDNLWNNDGVDFLENLEDVLLQADLGVSTTEAVLDEVRSLRDESFFTQADLQSILRDKLLEALNASTSPESRRIRFASAEDGPGTPTVIFFMGANGMGKTTTVGKLAHRLVGEGAQHVLVAACDTFRAGAVDQLRTWTQRSNSTLFEPNQQGDSQGNSDSPSAVLYGALDQALAQSYDTLLVDTSGRLSNNDALTQELVKMKRVVRKRLATHRQQQQQQQQQDNENMETSVAEPDVPHETLLVVDAAQGRMALDSARQWHQEVGLTGLILTKLDGSARGGSVVAVSRELGLPVKLVGVGEGLEDLRDFDPETFVDGLLGIGSAGGNNGAASANESKELEQRLETMRRARDERAKETTPKMDKQLLPQTVLDMDNEGVTPITAGATAAATAAEDGGRGNSNKNKKKKRKKKGKR